MNLIVLEIKSGDKFGVFEVKEATGDYLLLYNKDKSINLDQNTVQTLYGELKFKIADSSTVIRFYPFVEHTILAAKTELNDSNLPLSATTSAAQQSSLNAAAPSVTLPLDSTGRDTKNTE